MDKKNIKVKYPKSLPLQFTDSCYADLGKGIGYCPLANPIDL